uniref:Protein-disulfide isomerase n=1 Tax=Candidatus Kentrum sp. UNK TaxID=2126344 RepID=A0A451A6X9_9GAMM|nr:MAG: Protein-disulfide isomerase [Candidatus Kentron sp. UNK]VFK69997.1 MAG: Protein-disulfide isomerase [Candidatus Kentron sp. UNK]
MKVPNKKLSDILLIGMGIGLGLILAWGSVRIWIDNRAPVEIDTEGFPVMGNPAAKVTIVDFSDYGCSYCKTFSEPMKRIAKHFEGKVKVVYMDYLITGSRLSRLIAEGGVCADKQEKFWIYHDLAYQRQESMNENSPLDLAREIGLDEKAFRDCLGSGETAAKVERSEREGKRLELRWTPSIFVNGRPVIYEDFEQDVTRAVEAALAKFE